MPESIATSLAPQALDPALAAIAEVRQACLPGADPRSP